MTRGIRRLYNARLYAQYRGERPTIQDSAQALNTADRVLEAIRKLANNAVPISSSLFAVMKDRPIA
jgi:hypothetical protein